MCISLKRNADYAPLRSACILHVRPYIACRAGPAPLTRRQQPAQPGRHP